MKLIERLFADERAVSPVLGVALLIAMTVILAGVVGYVALGVDAGSSDAPQATLEFKQEGSSTVDLHHEGGDEIDATNVEVVIDGRTGTAKTLATNASVTELKTGGVAPGITNSSVTDGDTITIVWNDPESEKRTQLAEYRVE